MEIKRELLASIIIPKYIRTFCSSDAIRAKYFEKGKVKLPMKYCDKQLYKTQGILDVDGINYVWRDFPVIRKAVKRKVDFLVDAKTNERIVANEKHVGKPRIEIINGQAIYNGIVSRHKRNVLMGTLKDFLKIQLINSSFGQTLEFKNVLVTKKVGQTRETVTRLMPQASKSIERYPLLLEVEVWDHLIDREFSKNQDWDIGNRILPYNKAFEDVLTETKVIKDDCTKYVTGAPAPIFCPISTGEERKLVYNIYVDQRDIILNNPQYKKGLGSRLG